MTATRLLEWGSERARAGAWRSDQRTALLSPVPGSPPPSADFVRRCVATLAAEGYTRVVTSALSPSEQAGFRAAGFEVAERLHLLSHDLRHLPDAAHPAPAMLRRATGSDRHAVLSIDGLAFAPFWQLDHAGLDEALVATPHTRFRVAVAAGGPLAGYAVTGRAGRRGYVQRLAVHPDHGGAGIGRALVVDGLRWLRRWRVDRVLVNTQLENRRALELYERLGFQREPPGLCVLSRLVQP